MDIGRSTDWDIIIAIDADVTKSGVARLQKDGRKIDGFNLSFPELLEMLWKEKERGKDSCRVVVEAGYLNKSNWHLDYYDTKASAAAKGNAAGRNHEVARKIIEMCEYWGLPVSPVKPLKKCWKGKDGKITHEELTYFCPISNKKTNQDLRDAALLAWAYAGYPIRVKPEKHIGKNPFKAK